MELTCIKEVKMLRVQGRTRVGALKPGGHTGPPLRELYDQYKDNSK